MYILTAISLLLLSLHCHARIETAVIVPHGDFAYDPTLLPVGSPSRDAATKIAQASRRAAMSLLSNNLDVIILSSPHGLALINDFALFMGDTASGTATIGNDLIPTNTTFPSSYVVSLPTIALCPEIATQILQHLQQNECSNVTGIMVPDESIDMPLYWGEVIPLLLMMMNTTNNTNTGSPRTRIPELLILSHPRRRLNDAANMVQELLHLGISLTSFFEMQDPDLRVGVLISGDLSHTHLPEGPYGYSNASAAFDVAVGAWAKGNVCENGKSLLHIAKTLQPEAKSCAFTGLVLLHGLLCGDNTQQQSHQESKDWRGTVLANHNATYYGMMAATFERIAIRDYSSISKSYQQFLI